MRFLANGMLGKLTRWLRMLGHDVRYVKDLDDRTLIDIAKDEDRVLLTRDAELCRRAKSQNAKVYLTEGKTEAERLAFLSERFHFRLELDPDSSRCPGCNGKLRAKRKAEISKRVPTSTRRWYQEFWECLACGKIYWQGAHWRNINRTLEDGRRILEAKRSLTSP